MRTLADFAKDLARADVMFEFARHEALEKACQIVEDEAKRVIGTYDYGWKQLAPATQRERVRLGFTPNDPLLRSGELRDSITHHVVTGLTGTGAMREDAGYVGSPSKIALYQELGTARIPPRSFLGGAARAKEGEIHRIGATAFHAVLTRALAP
ncbi:hypothetical protein LG047_15340 [Methylocystis sp. WRRC1]|uniref:hypothetical protein n=1 Tax=Methylocystis sp. WRRC1 TaxID=1732014 RepID=UPI001D149682|nr:hypothetical protein [Methylocystis sp. WRRC1]MCC3246674.1 hypothetical protein [Methylocystis sp. WRRC1]